MAKTLKPYTIIPSELYVERNADRQIEDIIDDMGRPGYVLVSRQMGKTNLLLNAKRKLESPNDVFVYIDLSNPFTNARECFENIVDVAIELYEDKFGHVAQEIKDRRRELFDTPPHKQHTNELRFLLKSISGKIVIILDEIDALTKTAYSDQIFAQIRSVYFSRVNFPEMERLTYILSGVVEPSEIIKDPKISPFNIGQKIFLNDFSRTEFESFLRLSKLTLDTAQQDRIYHWTNGSPRVTWDLCSEIENKINLGVAIKETDIDDLVNEMYLKRFDKPPIDNIRELVSHDMELRLAITQILALNVGKISDKIKNKLYLAGITNFNDSNVEIKNEIIKSSLSKTWLKTLDEDEKGLLKLAVDAYASEDYAGALTLFNRFLSQNDFEDNTNKPHYYYMMAFSSYKKTSFADAIKFLNKTDFDLDDEAKAFYDTLLLKSLCFTYLEDFNEALANYKKVIDSGRKDETYVKSLINYASVAIKTGKEELLNNALEIFVAIINDLDSSNVKIRESQIFEVKSIAYYNSAIIYSTKGDKEVAEMYFNKALDFATPDSKPVMALSMANNTYIKERKQQLLGEIVQYLNGEAVSPKSFDPEYPLKFSLNEIDELTGICFVEFRDSFFKQLEEKLSRIYKKNLGSIIYDLAIKNVNKQNWDEALKLFSNLYAVFDDKTYLLTDSEKLNTLRFACYFSPTDQDISIFSTYADCFARQKAHVIDVIDIDNHSTLIAKLLNVNRLDDALRYVEAILRYNRSNSSIVDFLIIFHQELNIYKKLPNKRRSIDKALELINIIDNGLIDVEKSSYINQSSIDLIKENALGIVNTPRYPIQGSPLRSLGRNDTVKVQYADGLLLETKFKKIEEDIRERFCILI